jgi:hypothetical protein
MRKLLSTYALAAGMLGVSTMDSPTGEDTYHDR